MSSFHLNVLFQTLLENRGPLPLLNNSTDVSSWQQQQQQQQLTSLPQLSSRYLPERPVHLSVVCHVQLKHLQTMGPMLLQLLGPRTVHIQHTSKHPYPPVAELLGQSMAETCVTACNRDAKKHQGNGMKKAFRSPEGGVGSAYGKCT